MMEWITFYDWLIGTIFVASWVLGHAVIFLLLRKGGMPRASWKAPPKLNSTLKPWISLEFGWRFNFNFFSHFIDIWGFRHSDTPKDRWRVDCTENPNRSNG